MRRREALAAGSGLFAASSAGCLDALRREDAWRELVVDPPDGVYVPPHADEMLTYGSTTAAGREISLMATRPHSFWIVADVERSRADVRSRHDLHLMVDVRDAETGAVVPAPVTTTVERGASGADGAGGTDGTDGTDAPVDRRALWPMLSQRMGPHYGDNVPLEGEGTYAATVRVGPADAAVDGTRDELEEPTTVDFAFEYAAADIEGLERRLIDEDEGRGEAGALEPMTHGQGHEQEHGHDRESNGGRGDDSNRGDDGRRSDGAFDAADATRVGSETVGDVIYDAALLEIADRDGAASWALAVAIRTVHNEYPLPFAALSATVSRDEERIVGDSLRETIHPRYGHCYATPVDPALLERGDELAIELETPPQVARHEGYETAFLESATVSIPLEGE